MTNSAKSLALISIIAFVSGSLLRLPSLAIFSLAILVWMAAAYILFRFQCLRLTTRLTARRTIQESDSPTAFLWANRHYQVRLHLNSPAGLPAGTYIRDVLPELLQVSESIEAKRFLGNGNSDENRSATTESALQLQKLTPEKLASRSRMLSGRISKRMRLLHWIIPNVDSAHEYAASNAIPLGKRNHLEALLTAISPPNSLLLESGKRDVQLTYSLSPKAAGIATIPGVRICFSDYFHWFRRDMLVDYRQTINALPAYHKSSEVHSILKGVNVIPQHGIHRQRRPGMGFELLELREYQDGDPPKSIAWKASARRENLMTRQYETEVPVRVQLIVEGRVSSRVGEFGLRMLDQINQVATSIAHISTQNGDHVGAYLIDDNRTEAIASASGTKGFHKIAHALSKFSSGRYPRHVRWTEELQNAAYAVASEYYPRLLENRYNPTGHNLWDHLSSTTRRRHVQLANLIASRSRYDALQHAELLTDVHLLATKLQRFLCDHGAPWLSPLLTQQELLRSTRPTDWHPVVAAVQRSVARAKDNEVIVLFVDLLSAERRNEPLLEACKMARARKHRVVVISTSANWGRPPSGGQPNESFTANLRDSAEDLKGFAEQLRLKEKTSGTIKRFREQGIPCSIASTMDTIPWVLAEVELARSGRFTSTGASR